MSISDRLYQIEARIVRARGGRHTDRYMVLDVDAPAMLAALRAVLAGCEDREEVPEDSGSGADAARVIRRAVEDALGEA